MIDFHCLYCLVKDIIMVCFRGLAQSECVRAWACEDQQRQTILHLVALGIITTSVCNGYLFHTACAIATNHSCSVNDRFGNGF